MCGRPGMMATATAANGAAKRAPAVPLECPICTRRTGVWAKCDECEFAACKACVAANIEANPLQSPCCMSCRAEWDLSKVARSAPASFVNSKFRRIRREFLMSRERAMAPLSAKSLSLHREMARLDGEIAGADGRISAISRQIRSLPDWQDILSRNERSQTRAVGQCSHCNGLLVRAKIAKGAPTTVHCASCSRVGKQHPSIDAAVACPTCSCTAMGSWAWVGARTPFVMTRCCGAYLLQRLQRRGDPGKWAWASADDIADAAAAIERGDAAEIRQMHFKFAPHAPDGASCFYFGMGTGEDGARGRRLSAAEAKHGFAARHEGVRSLLASRVTERLREASLAAVQIATAATPADKERGDRESLLELLREVCDEHGPAPDVSALAPGTLVPALELEPPPHFARCDFTNARLARLRRCFCPDCLDSIHRAIEAALLRAPLEFLNNQTARAQYEAEMLRLFGLASLFREARSAVVVYCDMFTAVVVQYTENRISREDCVRALGVAHRCASEVIEAAREFHCGP